jgi:hypothetical protein
MPVTRDVTIMLLKRLAKEVPALGIGDEIQIVGRRRIERRTKSGLAGIGDGARGEAPVSIGVVGGREM